MCGILFCTHGKVIKPDFLNQFPGQLSPRVFGVVEIPELIKYITTSKTDFIRRSGRNRDLELIFESVRSVFKQWLKKIGVISSEVMDDKEAKQIERELKKIIEDVPELGDFLGMRLKKEVLTEADEGYIAVEILDTGEKTLPDGEGVKSGDMSPTSPGDGNEPTLIHNPKGDTKAKPISRSAKKGPKIGFVEQPDQIDLAWIESGAILINSGHPSYLTTLPNSKARCLHSLFAIGCVIQRMISQRDEENHDLSFIDRMMSIWGKK